MHIVREVLRIVLFRIVCFRRCKTFHLNLVLIFFRIRICTIILNFLQYVSLIILVELLAIISIMSRQRKKGVNPFLTMMSRETRAQLDIETEPYKCPKCRNERFESGWSLHSHWGKVHGDVMPEVEPSARKGSILKPSWNKVTPAKKLCMKN